MRQIEAENIGKLLKKKKAVQKFVYFYTAVGRKN